MAKAKNENFDSDSLEKKNVREFISNNGYFILEFCFGVIFCLAIYYLIFNLEPLASLAIDKQLLLFFGMVFFALAFGVVLREVRKLFSKMARKNKSIIRAFVFTICGTVLVSIASFLDDVTDLTSWITLFQSIAGSLWSNLLFFGLISLLIFFIQSREYERTRKVEERIDILFNREIEFEAAEMDYLKCEISKVATDHVGQKLTIDLVEVDMENQCFKFHIERDFHVRNYTKDVEARYVPEVSITTDAVPDDGKFGKLKFLSYFKINFDSPKRGRSIEDYTTGKGEMRLIDKEIELIPEVPLVIDDLKEITIKPDEGYVFRVAYEAWQPFNEKYDLSLSRHWNYVSFDFNNRCREEVDIEYTFRQLDDNEPHTTKSKVIGHGKLTNQSEENIPLDTHLIIDISLHDSTVNNSEKTVKTKGIWPF
ncbi:hypothetical protein [Kordiimonas sp. SCSIO 12610]|uniref:hypothetical protein n=1 Tax=Kordiimonas sp. SCSIO 12610 TaxID=2829597 RepID=UPI002109C1DF|nr:hypothetical protein [Kordiimonas sp. SCSIO 12610]UTW56047.1 hypothetical protein KFF44_03900 [Kordiimonas sp. SCSIO 12610]